MNTKKNPPSRAGSAIPAFSARCSARSFSWRVGRRRPAVLTGNPGDQIHVGPSLTRHTGTFGHAPDLYSSDRGFFNDANLVTCKEAGVVLTCIPQSGGGKRSADREAFEKSPAFKKGQRFRAGIEGRISVLFRGRGMKRALVEGRDRFELLVGAAVLANNLMKIADLLRQKHARRRTAAA